MQLDEQQYKIVTQLLGEWEQTGKITPDQKKLLQADVQQTLTDNSLSKYFFIIAVSSGLLAFAAIFLQDKLLETMKHYFALSNFFIAIGATVTAVLWFYFISKKRKGLSDFVAETYLLLGGIISLIAMVYFAKDFTSVIHYSTVLLVASVVFGGLSVGFRSVTLWVAALLAISGWFGSFSTYHSAAGLFLGMNYPLRFCCWGALCLLVSLVFKANSKTMFLYRITFVYALIALFTALWGLSVFGNYADFEVWQQVRQVQVLVYGVVFAVATAAAFFMGIKTKDNTLRDLSLLFLLLNLYTRYFEFFWDSLNKGIFFLILAVSFFGAGKWLERRKKINDAKKAEAAI